MSTATAPSFRTVGSREEIPEPWRSFSFLASDLPRYSDALIWGDSQALVLNVPARHTESRALVGVGAPEPLAQMLSSAFTPQGSPLPGSGLADSRVAVASLTRGAWDLLPAPVHHHLDLPRVAHWDWMVTTQAPPRQPGEERVEELDLATSYPELAQLQQVVLPETYTSLDEPGLRWFGWRDGDGVLRSLLAAGNWRHEVHLGSIGTHPAWRRQGLGTTLTAAVTRMGIEATGQVSLGLYSDNHAARRVYERLGFVLTQEVESRRPAR